MAVAQSGVRQKRDGQIPRSQIATKTSAFISKEVGGQEGIDVESQHSLTYLSTGLLCCFDNRPQQGQGHKWGNQLGDLYNIYPGGWPWRVAMRA